MTDSNIFTDKSGGSKYRSSIDNSRGSRNLMGEREIYKES